jgi:tetratricopeptide (TPR) repeat protein
MSSLLVLILLAQSPDFLAEGNRALDDKQYERAVELFTKAVSADPRDYNAEFQLALSYNLLNKDAEAVPHYQAVLSLNPGMYEAELNLGLTLLRMGDGAGAGRYLESATAKKSTPPGETALARALVLQQRLPEAEEHFRKASTLDPARSEDLLEAAAAYEKAGNAAEAIRIYREFPHNPGALERAGVLLSAADQAAESIPALEAAVAQSPTDANRVALAQAYLKAKQPVKAENIAAQAVAAQPRDADLRLFYGRLLRDQRKFTEAANQFLAAAQITPKSLEAWNELAAALTIGEQYRQALAALDQVRALGGEGPGNLFFRAIAHDRLQQRPEALAAYQAFLAQSQGKFPDQEFQARGRIHVLELELKKKR